MFVGRRSFVLIATCALSFFPVAAPPSRAQDQVNPDPKSAVWPPIYKLVSSGNVVELKAALLADPTQANVLGRGRMTPIGVALGKQNLEIVQALLSGGADPNKPFGPPQMLPLQGAATYGSPDAVKALLAKGADPKGKDASGTTALHVAVGYGLIDIAKLLLEKGADVNAPLTAGENVGVTPLHLAARSKSLPMVTALGAHQPNWNLTWNGRTSDQIAEDNGAKDVAEFIRASQKEPKSD